MIHKIKIPNDEPSYVATNYKSFVEVNAETRGKPYTKDGIKYIAYHDCARCKNASWYDDDYCNNQKKHFTYTH